MGDATDIGSALLAVPGGGALVGGRTASVGSGRDDAWLLLLDARGLVDAGCARVTAEFAP